MVRTLCERKGSVAILAQVPVLGLGKAEVVDIAQPFVVQILLQILWVIHCRHFAINDL